MSTNMRRYEADMITQKLKDNKLNYKKILQQIKETV